MGERLSLVPMTLPERFWSKVRVTSECWEWTACRDEKGYGRFGVNGRNSRAHRVAFEAWAGPIPRGMQLDHLCRNRACVNPDHLEAVTPRENTLRGTVYRPDFCHRGHPRTPRNTYRHPTSRHRYCRECREFRELTAMGLRP